MRAVYRTRYLARKVRRFLADGTLTKKAARRLVTSAAVPLIIAQRYRRLSSADRQRDAAAGLADHRHDHRTIHISLDTARRIQIAYTKAKSEETEAAPHFQIIGLWAEWRDLNHQSLMKALRGSPAELVELLENFEREEFARGTGAGHQEFLKSQGLFGHAYLRASWCTYRDKAVVGGVDPATVRHPLIGNPTGLWHRDSVIQCESWRHAFKAVEMAKILEDSVAPVVLEIGGGFGSQIYQFFQQCPTRFGRVLDFDLPETAAVASAFLITAFPDLQVCLYGEGPVSATKGAYEIGIFPHFAIDQIEDRSVDLVFNSNSFSEMNGPTAEHYLRVVERIARRWFRHTNHETRYVYRMPDGTTRQNMIGSEMVPDPGHWSLIWKRPRIFGKPEDITFSSYEYLYERLRSQ